MNLLIHSLFNRDWKLILKKEELLNGTEYRYHRLFKGTVTERGIIDYILSLDESLRLNYNAYQTIVFTVTHRKPDLFQSFIHEKQRGLSAKMDQALKTFRQSERAIVNALSYDYSNGLVEGINNKIKVIKRTAYGYRNFSNFRNRIFIEYKLLETKTAA
ncbi:transposase [Streptococcus gallolyticus]|uniref:transposase n=1 Tax=Streptococcus gallolyticus TaxID=315405 RepID=UPI001E3F8597|nr:transposase [Streptococcus gallolyticus]